MASKSLVFLLTLPPYSFVKFRVGDFPPAVFLPRNPEKPGAGVVEQVDGVEYRLVCAKEIAESFSEATANNGGGDVVAAFADAVGNAFLRELHVAQTEEEDVNLVALAGKFSKQTEIAAS
jgi:hypothetical protein